VNSYIPWSMVYGSETAAHCSHPPYPSRRRRTGPPDKSGQVVPWACMFPSRWF